ncbi:MAG TPA: hypothetical protein VJ915_00125 [Balneolaceae bacterium]|nr:hypothetical protein [Balneolaceae bacterium]
MALSNSNKLIEIVDNIIHQETQLGEYRFDLTISEIYEYSSAGSLDFGGGEFEPASTNKLKPVKKDSDDSYGWWNLAGGTYHAVCNESISVKNNDSVIVAPHTHAMEAGLMINTFIVEADEANNGLRIPLYVPGAGCKIKENARFASAYIISG